MYFYRLFLLDICRIVILTPSRQYLFVIASHDEHRKEEKEKPLTQPGGGHLIIFSYKPGAVLNRMVPNRTDPSLSATLLTEIAAGPVCPYVGEIRPEHLESEVRHRHRAWGLARVGQRRQGPGHGGRHPIARVRRGGAQIGRYGGISRERRNGLIGQP